MKKQTPNPVVVMDRKLFWKMIDAKMLNAKTPLYLYIEFNCDCETGQGLRIHYDEAARRLGFKKTAIYKARLDLIKEGLIESDDSGGFVLFLPERKRIAEARIEAEGV